MYKIVPEICVSTRAENFMSATPTNTRIMLEHLSIKEGREKKEGGEKKDGGEKRREEKTRREKKREEKKRDEKKKRFHRESNPGPSAW